jgi:phasin family protein
MTSKQAKDNPSRARSTEHWPEVLAYRGFDAAALVAGQQRAVEAWVAATQKFVEGMQELSKRQVLLQSALVQQAFANATSLAQAANPTGSPDQVARAAQSTMETMIRALRDTIDASCKCSMDAMAAFRQRMAGGQESGSPACEQPEVAPTTAEVVAARQRSAVR